MFLILGVGVRALWKLSIIACDMAVPAEAAFYKRVQSTGPRYGAWNGHPPPGRAESVRT